MKRLLNIARFLIIYLLLTVVLLEISLQLLHIYFKPENRIQTPTFSNALRIVTIGDSNTYGVYLEEQQTYPGQLKQRWHDSTLPNAEIINVGYPGTNSQMAATNMPSVNNIFKPDIIVVMLGVNDFWSKPGVVKDEISKPSWLSTLRVVKLFQLSTRNNFASNELDTGDRVVFDPRTIDKEEMKRQFIKANKARDPSKREYIRYGDQKIDVTKPLLNKTKSTIKPEESLYQNLNYIFKFTQNNDINMIIMTYPSGQSIYGKANIVLRQFASDNKLPIIDNEPKVYQHCHQLGICNQFLYPDQHATEQGNQIVADNIINFFIGQLSTKNILQP